MPPFKPTGYHAGDEVAPSVAPPANDSYSARRRVPLYNHGEACGFQYIDRGL